MNKKVTYLLGAGASYHALPILSEMKDTMKSLVVKLQQNNYHSNYAKNVVEDICWILKEADDYFTVDTLAKKFLHKKD